MYVQCTTNDAAESLQSTICTLVCALHNGKAAINISESLLVYVSLSWSNHTQAYNCKLNSVSRLIGLNAGLATPSGIECHTPESYMYF